MNRVLFNQCTVYTRNHSSEDTRVFIRLYETTRNELMTFYGLE